VSEGLDPRVVRTRGDVLQATIDVLVEEGWDAVSLPHVARRAGYSKATLYAHWPDRMALVRDALVQWGDAPHFELVGTLREDLLLELQSFRNAMVEHRLDRVFVVLADRAPHEPELVPVRDAFVAGGERVMRARLRPLLPPSAVDAAVLMLCGLMLHSVLLHGKPPSDKVLATAVDAVVAGFGLDPAA
jgi:AcrR family transcriptional regulator